MQEYNENRQNLYSNLIEDGYFRDDNGEINLSLEEFSDTISDIDNAKALYQNILEDGYFHEEDGSISLSEQEFLEMIGCTYAKREYYPITESQRGVYIDWEMNRDAVQYNIPTAMRCEIADVEAFVQALKKSVDAHPNLKCRFAMYDGDICQVRRDDAQAEVSVTTLDYEPDAEFFQKRVRPFDLFNDNLYRLEVYKSPTALYLFRDMHHIIFDGGSAAVFMIDVMKAFNGLDLETEHYSAFEYALDEQQQRDNGNYGKAEEYFDAMLAGTSTTVFPHSSQPDGKLLGTVTADVNNAEINKFIANNGLTASNYFLTVMLQTLHRITREEDVLVTAIENGRNDVKMQNITGMFVKTLPVTSSLAEPNKSVVETIGEVQTQFINSTKNDIFPFTELSIKHGVRPEIMYDYAGTDNLVSDYAFQNIPLALETSKMPVSVTAYPKDDDNYCISIEYNATIYSEADMRCFVDSMKNLAEQMPKAKCVSDISLLSLEEEKKVIEASAGEVMECDLNETWIDMFLRQVEANPDAVAVADANGSMTYGELNDAADRFHTFLNDKGIQPGEFIAIRMDRDKRFMVAAIGAHKAGVAYTPIDKEYPEERVAYMLEDSAAKLVVNETVMDEMESKNITPDASLVLTPDSLAYMIYTSGSTGKPKGVMIQHRALHSFICFIRKEWHLSENSHIACHSNFAFDAAVEDLYPVLTVGGTLYIIPEEARKDLDKLHQFIVDNGITGGCYTTQLGQMLLQQYPELPVDYLVVGGEKMTMVPKCQCRLINTYGPTEFTVDASFYEIEPGREYKNIPIGRPLSNLTGLVVDQCGHVVPNGIAGELCMAGPQMALGYKNRDDLTQKAFSCIKSQNIKVYHTGDLVRYNEEGQLEYLGRIDSQVKLRGFRIELGEIESQIATFPGIQMESVQVKEVGGVQHLCAYYTADRQIDADMLRSYLSDVLAEYMVPTAYVQLEEMPLTPNGKVNTKVLPLPEIKAEEIVTPETEMEQTLFDIAAELLKHNQFGVTSNLISMGLTSLSAMKLAVRIEECTEQKIGAKDILKMPTLRDIANYLQRPETIDDVAEEEPVEANSHSNLLHYYYPITENQRGVYIDWEMNRDAVQYNIPTAERCEGVDAEQLRDAFVQTVNAHPFLKTRLANYNDDIYFVRRDEEPAEVSLVVLDKEPDDKFFQSRVKPFDLFNDNLYRIEVYKTPTSVYFFTDMHHIIYDGVSDIYFMADVQKALNGEKLDRETYSSFEHSLHELDMRESGEYKEAEEYFDALLGDVSTTSYPASENPDGESEGRALAKIEGAQISKTCKKYGVTEAAFFMAATMTVLSRLTREQTVQIVTVDSGRDKLKNPEMMGMFVHTIPLVLRNDSADKTLASLVKKVQGQFIDTTDRLIFPFTKMVEKYGIRPEIMFNYVASEAVELSDGLASEQISLNLDTAKMPITVNVFQSADNAYNVDIAFDEHLYCKHDMLQLASAIADFVTNAVRSSDKDSSVRTADISTLSETEIVELNKLGRGQELKYDTTDSIVTMFRKSVAKYSDNQCVVYKDLTLTYAQVDKITDDMAVMLHEQYGVGAETTVGVMIDRSEYMLLYSVAVMKAGSTYMPLDAKFPEDRLMFMCEDAGVSVILSEYDKEGKSLVEKTMPNYKGKVWIRDIETVPEASQDQLASLPEVGASDRMIILYTSGSTGKPKGVELEHHGVVNFAHWYAAEVSMTADDKIGAYANYGFDAHMIDIYPALYAGASVYIYSSEIRMDLVLIKDYIEANNISIVFFTTQIGYLMISMCKTLRVLCLGGEKLPPVDAPDYELFNLYGPTECSIACTAYPVKKFTDGKCIGRPVSNCSLSVVDADMQLVPKGVPGELLISGIGVARGYLNRPELTKEKFITFQGKPSYRSGDLVKWDEEGNILYLGRIDNQVKLRGLRIELGEIENRISECDGIGQVCVDVKEISGVQHLCAYYVLTEGYTAPEDFTEKVKEQLKENLTEFMIPSQFIELEEFPLTPNGKVNKKALPMPTITNVQEYVEPESETEQAIADCFVKVLNLSERVGALDSFFSWGGDSIKAIRLVSLLRQQGIVLQVAQIMKLKTVREIAKAVDTSAVTTKIDQNAWSGKIESTPAIAQYFFNLALPQPQHFNQATMFKMDESVSRQQLEDILSAVLEHHDILRAHVQDNHLVVADKMSGQKVIIEHDLTGVSDMAVLKEKMYAIGTKEQHTFSLSRGPLVKALLFHTVNGDYLNIAIHHLLVDGVSWRIITEDLNIAAMQIVSGKPVSLPEKTHSYLDYSKALEKYRTSYALLQERPYWDKVRRQLDAFETCNARNYDRKTSTVKAYLSNKYTKLLQTKCNQAYNTEINDLLIAALGRMYNEMTGQNGLTIQMEGHGRENFDDSLIIDRTVGWFTSIYPVVLTNLGEGANCEGVDELAMSIRNTKETLHRVPNKGFGYGQIYGMDIDKAPLVTFNYLGEFSEGESDDTDQKMLITPDNTVECGVDIDEKNTFGSDFSFNGSIVDGQLGFEMLYNTARMDEKEAQRMIALFFTKLQEIIDHASAIDDTQLTASDLGETEWSDSDFRSVMDHFRKNGVQLKRIYPLTPMQEGMLLKHISDPESGAYRLVSVNEVNVQPTELQMLNVIKRLSMKHEVLCTSIVYKNVSPYRQAVTDRPVSLRMLEPMAADLTEAEEHDIALRHRDEMLTTAFDLQDKPLMQMELQYNSHGGCYMYIAAHHIIIDGWSRNLYLTDFMLMLQEELGLAADIAAVDEPETTGLYESYVRELHAKDMPLALGYWRDFLADYETRAEIPSTGSVPEEEQGTGEMYSTVDSETVEALKQICLSQQATLSNVVELIWGMVLQTYSRTDDAVFVKVVSGRDNTKVNVNNVVGLFINSVPVRVKCGGDTTARKAIDALQKQAAETNQYDFCPLSMIQQQSSLGSDLYQSVIAFQNFVDNSEGAGAQQAGGQALTINPIMDKEENINDFSMSSDINADGTLSLRLMYDASAYSVEQVNTVAELFGTLAHGIAAAPDAPLSSIPRVSSEEEKRILKMSAGVTVEYDHNETFIDIFHKQAESLPEAVALCDSDGSLTYHELDKATDAVANYLIDNGVKPNDFVAIKMRRIKEFVVSVIGIQKAGAAYVPVDPEYPQDRIDYMLEDSQAKVVLTEDIVKTIETDDKAVYVNRTTPDTLAYMIYTSGSTGKPKGVMLAHRALRASIAWNCKEFDLRPGKKNANHPSFSFDASTFDLFYPLAAGAEVHIMDDVMRKDMEAMARYIADNHITGMTMSTALGMMLLNQFDLGLEYIMLGGEKFLPVKKTSTRLYNGYGPTEFTVCSSWHIIDQEKDIDIPIGRPVVNSMSVVCDKYGNLLPQGIPGELCLIGLQIADGYWQRKELTDEKFTTPKFDIDYSIMSSQGSNLKMYHTGDLAAWNSTGELMFLGRIDNQVKLRGFRIEMGEVENQASLCPGALQTAAEIIHAGQTQFLCLYYTAEREIPEEEMKAFLSKCLTDYMVPSAYVQLDVMPMTPGGKIDRRRLPKPDAGSGLEMVAPENAKEHILFDIVAQLLGTTEFGVTDNLVHLGMTSLMGIRLVLMAERVGLNIKLNDFIKENTIRGAIQRANTFAFWAAEPEENKKAVVLVCGETGYSYLKPYIEALQGSYNVFIIEPITDHFKKLFAKDDVHEAVELYFQTIDYMINGQYDILAFTGHCFGGELAYRLANRWNQEYNTDVATVMIDVFWRTVNSLEESSAELGKLLPEEVKQYSQGIMDEANEAIKMYLQLGTEPEPPYRKGKYCLFRAMLPEPFDEGLERLLVKYNVDVNEVRRLFNVDRTVNNEAYWQKYLDNVDCYHVNANHMSMLQKEYVTSYVKYINGLNK